MYKSWLAERGKDFRAGVRITTLGPLQGYKNAIAWPALRTQPACSTPFTSSNSPVMPQVRYAAASSKTRPVTAGARGIPSTKSGFSWAPRVIGSRSVNKNDSVRPSRQMRRISVSKSPTTTAPSKCARSSTKPQPPKADAWSHTSLSAYQRVPSPKLLTWAGPYTSGRTPSWPTSDTAGASNGIIELDRRTARGYCNPTNYQLRMLLITGGLDASTHTQL